MFTKVLRATFNLAAILTLSACATIFSKGKQPVHITGEPGARITVKGFAINGSGLVFLPPKYSYEINATKECYLPVTGKIESTFRWVPTILGNLVFWLIPGLIVDLLSGNAWELDTFASVPSMTLDPNNRSVACRQNYDLNKNVTYTKIPD